MERIRIDKWLWAARFFKTRALAAAACEIGRVESNGNRAKASREVKIGDKLRITNEAGIFEIELLAISEIRGPAAAAQSLYRERPEGREARLAAIAQHQELVRAGGVAEGRPSKRDRREITKLRGRIHRFI